MSVFDRTILCLDLDWLIRISGRRAGRAISRLAPSWNCCLRLEATGRVRGRRGASRRTGRRRAREGRRARLPAGVSARRPHAAVMERKGITRIMSFDAGFGSIPGVERLGA